MDEFTFGFENLDVDQFQIALLSPHVTNNQQQLPTISLSSIFYAWQLYHQQTGYLEGLTADMLNGFFVKSNNIIKSWRLLQFHQPMI